MKSILVVAAHPDDEVLGCGGTMAKLTGEGAVIHVAFLASGVSSRSGDTGLQKAELDARRAGAQKACDILGVKTIFFGDFPDNRMDTIPLIDIVRSIEKFVSKYQPDAVFTHHGGDLNVDHQRTFEAVVTACRPQSGHPVRTILCFETPSSTEWVLPCGGLPIFSPNWFVDISGTLDRKMTALDAYAAEMRQWPHPRSRQGVEHLARWRGATVGVDVAEAFMLGRRIE